MKKIGKVLAGVGLLMAIIVIGFVIVVFATGSKKVLPFYNEDGSILEGSVAERVYLDVNGQKNGMIIRGKNEEQPVMLFLSGGPGVPEYWLNEYYENRLEEVYTVCWWDWAGEGLSYDSSLKKEELTLERLEQDACEVAEYLKERFGKEKIVLMAHSGGTRLGLKLAQSHPEHFSCYFAMGQVINKGTTRYEGGYEYLKKTFEETGDKIGLRRLNKLVKVENGELVFLHPESLSGDWEKLLIRAGAGTTREMRSDALGIFFPQMFCKCYTGMEKINYWRGKILYDDTPYHEERISLEGEEAAVIPVYFISGAYDYTCPVQLVEQMCENLEAPDKKLFIFENSAHSPLWEENEKVLEVLKEYGGNCK